MSMNATAGTQTGKAEAKDKPFAYLNEEAIRAAVLNNQPYDYAFVPNAVEERYKEEVLLDAPGGTASRQATACRRLGGARNSKPSFRIC